jgi:adenine-specific DNA methylase
MTTKRAIEEDFPIVEINRLAVPERNSFKPIYQMHKWFARRASCVFRAILLGALKPAGTNIMEEFYKDHTNDPDTNGKRIPLWRLFGSNPAIGSEAGHQTYLFGENLS